MAERTGEVREISLLDIMGGAIADRVNYEFDYVARNLLDPNTDANTARKLTIEIWVTPTEDRRSATVKAVVSSKLAPVKQLDATLLLGGSADDPTVMVYHADAQAAQLVRRDAERTENYSAREAGIRRSKHVKSSN